MKRIILRRINKSSQVTYGVFIDPLTELPICLCLELPWRWNEKSLSCIPKGVYVMAPYKSDRFDDVYEIKNVPNRTYILSHPANTVNETKGCILPGMEYGKLNGLPSVLRSREAMDLLRNFIGDESCELEIA